MDPAGLRQERICADCGGFEFVEDHAAGDIVCKSCGLVAEAHIIDERSEWRTFGDKEKEGDDPSRVGAASNPLLDDGGLSTGIGTIPGGTGQQAALQRLQQRQSGGDRAMQTASKEIGIVCDRLRVTDAVKNSALQVFKTVREHNALKGRSLKAQYAACIFVGAKNEGNNRTFKEICALMPEVNKRDVARCYTSIDLMYKKLAQRGVAQRQAAAGAAGVVPTGPATHHMAPGQSAGAATQAAQLVKRFMERLGVADTKLGLFAFRVGQRAAEVAAEEAVTWASRDPATQACAIIYGVMHINKLKNLDSEEEVPSFEALAKASGMAPNTIKEGFKQMLPDFMKAGKLVSDKDARPQVLRQLDSAVQQSLAAANQDAKAARRPAAKNSRATPPASTASGASSKSSL